MFDLYELQAFVEFADCGTLSKAAENLHISQPTLTRTMKHMESEFGVELFVRSKNRIELNKTGLLAAEQAKALLTSAENMARQVRSYDRSLHTIMVESCAPAPLRALHPVMLSSFPENTISSSLREVPEIIRDISSGECRVGIAALAENESADGWKEILPDQDYLFLPYLQENLYLSLRPDHPLAGRKEISFAEMNGMNFLVRSELGFWGNIHRKMMPDSVFLAQNDENGLFELLKNSTIPGFVTNVSMHWPNALQNRTYVPISDPQAHICYFLICAKKDPIAGFLIIAAEKAN